MEYPFITLDDGTQISHSEMLADRNVLVYGTRSASTSNMISVSSSAFMAMQHHSPELYFSVRASLTFTSEQLFFNTPRRESVR